MAAKRSTNRRFVSRTFCASAKYLSRANSDSAGKAPSVIRRCPNDSFLPGFAQDFLSANSHSDVAIDLGGAVRRTLLVLMISAQCGRSSIPTVSRPRSLAAKRAVPDPANGSSSLPELISSRSKIYRINAAEKPSLYLHQRFPFSCLLA